MKILMFGWELPPFNSGGLGVACFGMAEALAKQGHDVTFVLPHQVDVKADFMKIIFASSEKITSEENNLLSAYISPGLYKSLRTQIKNGSFNSDLFGEVARYAKKARQIALSDDFDVIHAHDWLSFGAGMEAKKAIGKPLIAHVHATEFDRGGGSINPEVYEFEKMGMETADKVVSVSNLTKNLIVEKYGISASKVQTVHNQINPRSLDLRVEDKIKSSKDSQIVLFVGRITLQKGLDYFLKAAKTVLKFKPNTLFVVAGSGDMEQQMIELAATLGISNRVIFAGFLRGTELSRVYASADLFVMPSVSEPFGITPLESLINGTPVILSRQSGVSEVIKNALLVDFWDTDEMANQILCVLNYPSLHKCLQQYGKEEVMGFNWKTAALKLSDIYRSLVNKDSISL